jgi:hypothetical protein
MIDLALCLSIKASPALAQRPYLTTANITRLMPTAKKMSDTTVLDSLIAAALGSCENPLTPPPVCLYGNQGCTGSPIMCSRTPVPPPVKVPTKPTTSEATKMRLYLGKSLKRC